VNQLNLIESALALHLAGKYMEAEFAYRRILATDPQHVEAKHYLGMLLHKTGNTPQALELIRSAIETDASSPGRYSDLGNIHTEINELNNAVAAFRCALALNVQDANVWNNLGSVLHHLHDLSGAEAAYLSALHLDINLVPALSNLAVLLAETGRKTESALFSCQAYIQPPLAGKSKQILAYAYYQLGRLTDAAQCYRAWLSIEPDNAFAIHHLAACTAENVPVKASDDYLKALFNAM
jgi:tetratricopeptide (TPR) repeat protein